MSTIFDFLKETLDESESPPDVVAHGLSGTIAALFAQQFPQLFRSLTLISVDSISSKQWSSDYFAMRRKLPCSRSLILSHIVPLLFDNCLEDPDLLLSAFFAKCLDSNYILGSVASHAVLPNLSLIDTPLLIINGDHDFVVGQNSKLRWKPYLKPGDRFCSVPGGHHFSHFSRPSFFGSLINPFWE